MRDRLFPQSNASLALKLTKISLKKVLSNL